MSPLHRFRRWIIALRLRRVLATGIRETMRVNRQREQAQRAMQATIANPSAQWSPSLSAALSQHQAIDPDGPKPQVELPPPLPPGRQRIRPTVVRSHGMFGMVQEEGWQRPVPAHAQHAPWESRHTFPPGREPKRDPYLGIRPHDPPLSFICPACDLEQAPVGHHDDRDCPYCGVHIKLHGTTLYWWRPEGTWASAPEWKP